MALTQTQVREVLAVLKAAFLNNEIVREIEEILNLHCGNGATGDTPYANIKAFANAYKTVLQTSGHGVVQTNYLNEMLLVYMDRASVISVLAQTPTNGYLAGIMGVWQNTTTLQQQLTISLLAADTKLAFMKDANGNYLPGEQCWKQINTVGNFDAVFG